MTKVTVAALKKAMSSKTQKELIQEITELYKKFSAVKDYYQIQLGDPTEILNKYKDVIQKEFIYGYTKGMPKARLSVARKAVQEFKKTSPEDKLLADLMLTFVESVSQFTLEFGVGDESYYTSSEGMYADTLEFLSENSLSDLFQGRCFDIVQVATPAWGYKESLSDIYEHFFGLD